MSTRLGTPFTFTVPPGCPCCGVGCSYLYCECCTTSFGHLVTSSLVITPDIPLEWSTPECDLIPFWSGPLTFGSVGDCVWTHNDLITDPDCTLEADLICDGGTWKIRWNLRHTIVAEFVLSGFDCCAASQVVTVDSVSAPADYTSLPTAFTITNACGCPDCDDLFDRLPDSIFVTFDALGCFLTGITIELIKDLLNRWFQFTGTIGTCTVVWVIRIYCDPETGQLMIEVVSQDGAFLGYTNVMTVTGYPPAFTATFGDISGFDLFCPGYGIGAFCPFTGLAQQ